MSEKQIKVLIDENFKCKKKINTDWSLQEARQSLLTALIQSPFDFIQGKKKIAQSAEGNLCIKNILINELDLNLAMTYTIMLNNEKLDIKDYLPTTMSLYELRQYMEKSGFFGIKFKVSNQILGPELEDDQTIQECLVPNNGIIYIIKEVTQPNNSQISYLKNSEQTGILEDKNHKNQQSQILVDTNNSLINSNIQSICSSLPQHQEPVTQNFIQNKEEMEEQKQTKVSEKSVLDSQQEYHQNEKLQIKTNFNIETTESFERAKIEQNAQELFEQGNRYPECLERSIQLALSIIMFKNIGSVQKVKDIQFTENLDVLLQKEIQKAIQFAENQQVLSLVNQQYFLSLNKQLQANNYKEISINLNSVMKQIMPLDIQKVQTLIDKADEASIQVADKDVILFQGITGAGKSTTIHLLAGSKMEKRMIENVAHYCPTEIIIKEAQSVTANPFNQSETRYITAVPIKFQGDSIILCDSPGYEDTSGPVVDIANGIGITRAIKRCKSVRPVFLFSGQSIGDRFQEIKKVAYLVSSMVNDMEDTIETFQYVFTKFSQDQMNGLTQRIAKFIEDELEKDDEIFKTFLKDLHDKAKYKRVFFIDPLQTDIQSVLTEMTKKKNQIKNPSGVFKFYITKSSHSAIQEQVTLHIQRIQQAFCIGDIKLVIFKLNEIRFIADILDSEKYQCIFRDCCFELISQLNSKFQEITSNIMQFFSLENTLVQKQIEIYMEAQKFDALCDELKKTHLSLFNKDIVSNTKYTTFIGKQVNQLMQQAVEMQATDPKIGIVFDKINLLDQFFLQNELFPDNPKNYIILQNAILDKLDKEVTTFLQKAFEHSLIKEHVIILDNVAKIINNLEKYMPQEKITTVVNRLNDEFNSGLTKKNEEINKILNSDLLEKSQLNDIKSYVDFLLQSLQFYARQKLLKLDHLKLQLQQTNDQILVLFNISIKIVNSIIDENKNDQSTFFNLKNIINNNEKIQLHLKQASSIQNGFIHLQKDTLDSYYKVINRVIVDIQQFAWNILSNVEQLQSQDRKFYTDLNKQIEDLDNLVWIDSYQEGLLTKIRSQIKEQLEQFQDKLFDMANKIILSLERPEDLDKISNICFHMEQMQNLLGTKQSQNKEQLEKFLISFMCQVKKLIKHMEAQCEQISKKRVMSDEAQKSLLSSVLSFNSAIKKFNGYEQSLKFLNKFINLKFDISSTKLNKMKEESETLLNNFQKNIEGLYEASKLISNQLFIAIKSFNDNADNILLNQQSKELQLLLINLSEINDNTELFKAEFDAKKLVLTQFEEQLATYVGELEENMQLVSLQCIDNPGLVPELRTYLLITRALQNLDDFNKSQKKIKDIYSEYNKRFAEIYPQASKTLLDNIITHNFTKVGSILQKLSVQTNDKINTFQLTQAKETLQITFDNLIKDTRAMASRTRFRQNISEQMITVILSNIGKLREGKQLSKYISDDSVVENPINGEIEKIVIEVNKNYKNHMERLIKQLDTIQFIKAINDKEIIEQQYFIFEGEFNECSKEQLKVFNEAQDNKIENLYNNYKGMLIQNFIDFPPKDIIKELENCVKDKTNSSIKDTKERFVNLIYEKFHAELKIITDTEVQQMQHLKIQKFKRLLQTLPEAQQIQLENDLDEVLKQIEETNSINEIELNIAKDNSDWKKIGLLYTSNKNNVRQQQQIKEILLKEIKSADQDIKLIYPLKFQLNLIHKLKNAIELHKICNELFANQMHSISIPKQQEISQEFFYIKQYFTQYLQEETQEQSSFSNNEFDEYDLQYGSQRSESTRESQTDILVYFLKFREEEGDLCTYIIPNFDDQILQMIALLREESVKFKKQFQEALKTRNFQQLFLIYDIKKSYIEPKKKISYINFKVDILIQLKQFFQDEQICDDFIYKVDPLIKECIKNARIKVKGILNEIKLDNLREIEYRELNILMKQIQVIEKEGSYLFKNIAQQQNQIQTTLNQNMQVLFSSALQLKADKLEDEKYLIQFNISLNNLATLNITLDPCFITQQFDIAQAYEGVIKGCNQSALNISNFIAKGNRQQASNIFIKIKRVGIYIPYLEQQIDDLINKQLNDIKKLQMNKGIQLLSVALLTTEIGSIIINQHKVFSSINLDVFLEKTRKHDITYVLKNIQGDEGALIDKQYLKEKYDQYESIYQQNIAKATINPKLIPELISRLVAELQEQIQKYENLIQWKGQFKEQFAVMVAKISAIWTLTESKEYFEPSSYDDDKTNNFLQPHPAQIISIFSLLGMGDKINQKLLSNTLVEIGTGEGKSHVLAITSSVFVLLGFEINCACYSTYLSERDLSSFAQLFQVLKVDKYIHYGNFNKLCERMINLQIGDLRKVIGDIITKNDTELDPINDKQKRVQVLLIDEVDVFFSKDFYGEVYSPQSSLKNPLINQLLDLIWSKKDDDNITLEKIQQTQEYMNVLGLFKNWQNIIDESVKDMIADVKTYQGHQYIFDSNKIGYKEQDRVVFSITFGYKTIFAYYAELKKLQALPNTTPQQINELQNNLREASCIGLNCGNFSYALIPASFKYIMGVSGTLKELNNAQVNMIRQNYDIKKRIYMPSVFGLNNLKFNQDDDLIVCEEQDYYNAIYTDINSKINNDRAVLVFFETKDDLLKFYESKNYAMLKQQTHLLTEEEPIYKKENIITRATSSKSVTLFTKCFGRGTDFKAFDKLIIDRGGVHVISTFFSEDISEEVQIKGRTARQGQLGTFKIIILDSSLEKFQISKNNGFFKLLWDIFSKQQQEVKQLTYLIINQHRDMYSKNQFVHNIKKAQDAKVEHEKACYFQSLIIKGNKKGVQEMLLKYNIGANLYPNSRTIVLMDATGSMGSLLEKCKSSVSLMFERACSILVENGGDEKCFILQFVAYRNYNAPENQLLEYSPWTSKPEELKTFMNMVKPNYGMGNEAVEVGLWHAGQENNKKKISQIILIADMPPNTKDALAVHKNKYQLYKNTRFASVQSYEIELQKFINQKIPVHAFYVGKEAQVSFEDIAQKTGGQCSELKIHSDEGAEMLTNLVTQEILRSVGGEKMVKDYQKKYTH